MKTVIVIEPSDHYRNFLQQFLQRLDYAFLSASGVGEGMELVRSKLPDLVILGDGFADGGELQLCQVITNDPLTGHIPVLMLHSDDRDKSKQAAITSGCTDFLSKPVKVRKLYDSVEQLISRHRRTHIRTPMSVGIMLQGPVDHYGAVSHNFGEGGVFLRTDTQEPLGTMVDLSFTLPGRAERFRLEGEVIFSSGKKSEGFPTGMGIKFTGLDPGTKEALSGYMERYLSGTYARDSGNGLF